jgi:hypothetical protein
MTVIIFGGTILHEYITEKRNKMEETKCECGANVSCECGPEKVVKDLEYWRLNAEEDYITTPISVLRYIGELEKGYSEEDIKTAFLDGWELRNGELPFPKAKNKWFERFKKK